MVLANMQEQVIKQQEYIQQRKIYNQQTIHHTIRNATKRLRTTYVFTPETNLIPLALEMLVSKKKDNSLNVLLVSLNYRGVHAHITPKMLDVLCTGNLTPSKTLNQHRSTSSNVLHHLREHSWKRWTLSSSYNLTKTTVTSNPCLTSKKNLYSKTPSLSQDPSPS